MGSPLTRTWAAGSRPPPNLAIRSWFQELRGLRGFVRFAAARSATVNALQGAAVATMRRSHARFEMEDDAAVLGVDAQLPKELEEVSGPPLGSHGAEVDVNVFAVEPNTRRE